MKKILIIFSILFLIIATTITKNSTNKLDKKIFEVKENLRLLNDKYELVLLEYNYLTSPEKLMEYQNLYFENELIPTDIEQTGKIDFYNESMIIKKFIDETIK